MLETYRPSGSTDAAVVIFAPVCAMLLTAGAVAYQSALYWIPLIYLNILATFGFALLINYACRTLIRRSRCRNVALASGVALLVSLTAVAATHVVSAAYFAHDLAREVQKEYPDVAWWKLMQAPGILPLLWAKADTGFSITHHGRDGGPQLAGIAVYLIWAIEAAILLVAGARGAFLAAKSPFSEMAGAWADQELLRIFLRHASDEQISCVRNAPSVSELAQPLGQVDASSARSLSYVVKGHPDDSEQSYLTLSLLTHTLGRNGQSESKVEPLWSNVILRPSDLAALRQLEARVESQPDQEGAAPEADGAPEESSAE